jgi:hypothetical protein
VVLGQREGTAEVGAVTARRPSAADRVADFTVAARDARVWLHQDGDGDLTPAEARTLARKLRDAAARSEWRARATARAERNRQEVERQWADFNMEVFDLLDQEGDQP